MRRHYTNYFKGIRNFKPIRTKLVEAATESEVVELLQQISSAISGCGKLITLLVFVLDAPVWFVSLLLYLEPPPEG